MSLIEIKGITDGFEIPDLEEIVRDELRKESKKVLQAYEQTTRTWDTDVDFEVLQDKDSAIVGTDNQIYQWVDKGTKGPYPIPKTPRPYNLRFRVPYRSKTRVNVLTSRSGGIASNAQWVSKKQVTHPGIKARNFTKLIQKKSQKRFATSLRRRLKKRVRQLQRRS